MKAPEQQNALFRSSCVALVMLCTARKSAGKEAAAGQRIRAKEKKKERRLSQGGCLRPFIMCVFYYPDSWHPPDPSGISLFISNL